MKILVLRHIQKNSVDDIFHQTDYLNYELSRGVNVGNKLWLMGLVSSISTPENQIDFLEDYMDADYINANYDACIKPEANIFSKRFVHFIEDHLERYKGVRIPIYVIACGVQADSYDGLPNLIEGIGDVSKRFIESVYKTGGEFCLRGYFTKEFFNKLGYNSAVVTGCPSMYQFGRGFKVEYQHVSVENFIPVLNVGEKGITLIEKPLKDYPYSEFIDQSYYYDIIYKKYQGSGFSFVKKYGYTIAKLLKENRLQLFIDLQDWADYLKYKDFNFACGSRIHGNIMPILMGIPAAICPIDSRTREMAEFFDIPMITEKDLKKKSLYSIYLDTDYKRFNESFAEKYDVYENFLIEKGIVQKANTKPMLCRDKNAIKKERLNYIESIKADNTKTLDEILRKRLGYKAYDFTKKFYSGLRK